jgi:hypothetical protein
MGKKISRISQKLHKMKGCSKKTRKNYLGGSSDISLAYTGKPQPPANNPFLAYTGKGGASSITPPTSMPVNINAANKTIPNTGPPVGMPTAMTNQAGSQKGGDCGCSGVSMLSGGGRRKKRFGGSCGSPSTLSYMTGGNHRIGCKCTGCKVKQTGGNPGLPYPSGLAGSPWTSEISGWPGVDGIQGDRNYSALNTYPTDVQTAMISPGANPPFVIGGKKIKGGNQTNYMLSPIGGKRRSRKQRGGALSNLFSQDLINLGRQFQFGLGSAYNGLAGYAAPINPLPWKGQLPNTPSLNTVKTAYIV